MEARANSPDQGAIKQAIDEMIARLPSSESRRSYRSAWQAYNQWLAAEGLHVLEVKPRHVETYIAWMRDKQYARGTVGRAMSVMQMAYDSLLRAELIEGNPSLSAD